MSRLRGHVERHGDARGGWLRAAVLGANDGIVSTAALVVGVAAAGAGHGGVLVAGLAGLVGGAMSMATGEYVSVSSQADAEHADLSRERMELEQFPEGEREELAGIYVARGLAPALAHEVADALMAHDALGAHARDELGIHELTRARPVQAALASAAAFAVGAALPLLLAVLLPEALARVAVPTVSLLCLALLGAWAARVGGASMARGALRVVLWSALAMAFTWLVGRGVDSLG
jgi:VIT1/CCC1 family predicted Fe2+/Mn2+ transporter